jgi:hypothetical protein
MGQDAIVEIIKNAYFSMKLYGKHGLHTSFRARLAGGGKVEKN